MAAASADVLNVFADETGNFGNPVGIVVDEGGRFDNSSRVAIAKALGFSESVFINDVSARSISIFTGQQEIAFAGHAAVGVAWYLKHKLGQVVQDLRGMEGDIRAWSEGDLTWVSCNLQSTPPWIHEYVRERETLEALTGVQDPSQGCTQLWTWINENEGTVRSRTFAPAWGIAEDEANGSGCMRLAACLGVDLTIHHGRGSVIRARHRPPGYAEVGGLVAVAHSIEGE